MKNAKILSIVVILVLSISSCQKDEMLDSDYIIFGSFYGMCQGENCILNYKLTENTLYKDQTKNNYPDRTEFLVGDFAKLGRKDFNKVDLTPSDIPQELMEAKSGTIFGCPDCADGGGIYIEYKSGETHKFWVIDNMEYQIPTYLHPFVDKIHQEIANINE